MNINFENLEKIEEIYNLLILLRDEKTNQLNKKWLTTEELSTYIGYSKESIKNMIRKEELQIDKHYFRIAKKNLFDKVEIDKWIMGIDQVNNINYELVTDEIIQDMV